LQGCLFRHHLLAGRLAGAGAGGALLRRPAHALALELLGFGARTVPGGIELLPGPVDALAGGLADLLGPLADGAGRLLRRALYPAGRLARAAGHGRTDLLRLGRRGFRGPRHRRRHSVTVAHRYVLVWDTGPAPVGRI